MAGVDVWIPGMKLGLAPLLVAGVFRTVLKINQEGVTVLLVEQNVRQSLTMAQRAYVLENGRMVREGKGKELIADEHVKEAYLGVVKTNGNWNNEKWE